MILLSFVMQEEDITKYIDGKCHVFTFWYARGSKVRETFDLNQLKSAPSQLLPIFSRFDWLQPCCQ